jgi:polyhydroxybutyrate depolymerase
MIKETNNISSAALGVTSMKYRLAAIGIPLTLLCGAVIGMSSLKSAELPTGHQRLNLSVGDREREAILYVPLKYRKSVEVPLVFMLHGMGGTATNAIKETGWSKKADEAMFIVVYPEATRPDAKSPPSLRANAQAWNDGSGRFHAAEQQIDDIAFIEALVDRVVKDYSINPKCVFVAGFSNGASTAFRVGAELPSKVAAIAPNAGACWTENLRLTHGVSLCYITGAADTLNPLEGGFPKLAIGGKEQGGRKKPPVQETIGKWVKALNCEEKPDRDTTTNGVRVQHYGKGRDGAEVEFTTVESLGHHWAGGAGQAPDFLVGKNTKNLNATDVVWEIFSSHPKR